MIEKPVEHGHEAAGGSDAREARLVKPTTSEASSAMIAMTASISIKVKLSGVVLRIQI